MSNQDEMTHEISQDQFPEIAKAERELVERTGDMYLTMAVITSSREGDTGHRVIIRPTTMMILASNKVVGEELVRTLRAYADHLEGWIKAAGEGKVDPIDLSKIPFSGTIQ